jgi:SAM-dependent methyltransferase
VITGNKNKIDLKNVFEEQYISLRRKEGRLFTDEEVAMLPNVSLTNGLKKEWEIRKASSARLIQYLSKRQKPLNILEVGCGNGWLSNQLSQIKNAVVTGLDVNSFELEQAARVFGKKINLSFVNGDLREDGLHIEKFDVIVFAASIQYFSSLPEIVQAAFEHLKADGEIHILDSHFYEDEHIEEAKKRSNLYFSQLGFNGMNDFYFHHALSTLNVYNYKFLFNPKRMVNKLLRRNDPFHWICIQHS